MDQSGFYHTPESVASYLSMADGYDGKGLIEELRKYLPAQSTVLEMGVGPGKDMEILLEDYQVTGSDYSGEFLDRLRRKNPDWDLIQLNAITMDTPRTFDAMYSNKVLYHLNPKELAASVQRQADRLNPGGLICHSFWEGNDLEEMHGLTMNYLTLGEVEALFRDWFEILHLDTYAEMAPDDSILVIARKKSISTV